MRSLAYALGLSLSLLAVLPFTAQAQDLQAAPSVGAIDHVHNTQFNGIDGLPVQGVRCATPHATEAERIADQEAMDALAARFGGEYMHRGGTVTIPVAFHVVRSGLSVSQGNIPDSWIADQIQVLNDAFGGNTGGFTTNFQFVLDFTDRTTNSSWYTGCYGSAEFPMKAALNFSPATHLNVYSCSPSGGILGYAYLPSSFPENDYRHGIVVLDQSLPGGSAFPYHLGDTGTHEVGHYLGLYHTFDFGCSPGDFVADTPAEANPRFGCPTGAVSCGSPDPINNFMDYTDDSCMFEFTAGQSARMDAQVATYKPTLLAGGGTASATVFNGQVTSGNPVPSNGGRIDFQFTLDNSSGSTFSGEYWVDAFLPGGTPYNRNPVVRQNITLSDGQNQTIFINNGNVPGGAPAGEYTLRAYVGPSYPNDDDTDDFFFTKSGPAPITSGEDVVLFSFAPGTSPGTASARTSERGTTVLGAYPNPFNPSTTLRYEVTERSPLTLAVYNTLGQRVAVLASGTVEAGVHEAVFDASVLPSGVYVWRLESGAAVQTGRLLLVK